MAEPLEFFDSLDEISVDFQDASGHLATRQTDKIVLGQRGTYALVMFVAQVRSRGGKYRPRVMIHRYRKIGGGWRKAASVNMDPAQLARAAVFMATNAKTD